MAYYTSGKFLRSDWSLDMEAPAVMPVGNTENHGPPTKCFEDPSIQNTSIIFTMDTIQERETPNQPPSERIQHAMEELRKSGNAQCSTSQSNFTDSCNDLLHLPFYSEEGRLRVIQNLTKFNGNFVMKIIRKGLSGLNKIYQAKTFEDESIKLVELCVSLYLKKVNQEAGCHIAPEPAIVVDCIAELCEELTSESGRVLTKPEIPVSKCMSELINIFETMKRANLGIDETIDTNYDETFKYVFQALKSRISDDLFEELLHETHAIARQDLKLDFLNLSLITGLNRAMLLQAWRKLLEFPFVTTWFTVQTARTDVLLHDEDYAQRIPYGNPITYEASLVCQVAKALEQLNSQGNYELSCEKKRLQVFLEHQETFLRQPIQCLELLASKVSTECIREVFKTLAIKLDRSLWQMTDEELDSHNDFLKRIQFNPLNIFEFMSHLLLLDLKIKSRSITDHQTVDFIVNITIQAMIQISNHDPILTILLFWKRTFFDDKEYSMLSHICKIVKILLQLEKRESNIQRLATFLTQIPIDFHSTPTIGKFLICLANEPIFIQDGMNENTLKRALSLFDEVSLTHEYGSILYAAADVISEMETNDAEQCLLDFLHALQEKELDQDNCIVVQIILKDIKQHYCTSEKAELFRCLLQFLKTSSKTKIISGLEVLKRFTFLQTNAANTVKFFDILKNSDIGYCHQIVKSSELCKDHYNNGLHEFIHSLVFAEIDKTICSKENCHFTFQNCPASESALKTFSIYLKEDNDWSKVQSIDIASLYMVLIKAFHSIKSSTSDNRNYIANYICGLQCIFRLQLPLLKKIFLIEKITEILGQYKFNFFEVYRIMGHLFATEDRNASLVDSDGLSKHFKEVMNLSVIEKLSKIAINVKVTHAKEGDKAIISGPSITLMKLLTEKTPLSFKQGTSKNLFDFLIMSMEKTNHLFIPSVLVMASSMIEKNVTSKEFKKQYKNIKKFFTSIPSFLIPLVSECQAAGLNGKRKLRSLIKLLRNSITGQEDEILHKVNTSITSVLNIPKQLVLALQENSEADRREYEIKRVLDVACQLDPQILFGGVDPDDNETIDIFQTIAPHDFHVLMRHTNLKPEDVCIVLNAYTAPKDFPFQECQFTMDRARLDADTNWSEDYDPSKALTPGKITYFILEHLRRLNVNVNDIQSETLAIFRKIVENHSLVTCLSCPPQNFKDYIMVFACIMKRSRSVEEIKQWLELSGHDIVACKEVILEAYTEVSTQTGKESLRTSQKLKEVIQALSSKASLCNIMFYEDLNCMAKIFKNKADEEIIYKLLEFLSISVRATATCVDVITGWNKTESVAFLTKLREKYPEDMGTSSTADIEEIDNKIAVWLPLLPFVSKAFPNHSEKVGNFLDKMLNSYDIDDPKSLTRIPIWSKTMTDAGISQQIINSWCISLILYENLTSSDVDAITNLTPSTIQIITKETGEIEKCLFISNAPKTWRDENSDPLESKQAINSFKRCLRFAKYLNEFTSIAKQFKENARALERIKEETHALCSSFSESPNSSDGLYKVLDNVPKELFVLLFAGEDETKEESLSVLKSDSELSQSLSIAFRRLARSVTTRPILFGHLKSIVDHILQYFLENSEGEFHAVRKLLNREILGLMPNQDAIHSLQAVGYNQNSPNKDLWYSLSIEISSNVSQVVSVKRFCMRRVLTQLCREWRSILLDLDIKEVEVNGKKVKTTDLMRYSDSLETMESQLKAVKIVTKNVPNNEWSGIRRKQLIQQERTFRHQIEEQEEQARTMKSAPKEEKLIISWNNQFLDSVKTCSEKIPGCYAPNGFHSEKPVICGLSVDNRILTLFKEERNGKLTELEDVEVKLYPVGMLVFEVYSSCFTYDTDQLWAAFFKELLLKRLVPKIFLTNVSPGFEWIKRFVQLVTNSPENVNFWPCNSLIPAKEDSLDYKPNRALQRLNTQMADPQMKELIIVTQENVKDVEFNNLQSPHRDKIVKERMGRLQNIMKNHLQRMHPKSHVTILNRLCSALRKAIEFEMTVNDEKLTEEMISSFIDIKKLSQKCEDSKSIEENGNACYGRIIMDALQTQAVGNEDESNKVYDFVVNMPNY